VVGVVADVRHSALEEASGPEMYLAMRQTGDYPAMQLVVRTALPPDSLAEGIRTALRPIDPNVPVRDFQTFQELVDKAISPRRALLLLSGDLQSRIALRTLSLAGFGLVLGLAASRALSRGLGSLLFGVTAGDPATFAGIALALIAVSALAGYIPALRASRIDPMTALRSN